MHCFRTALKVKPDGIRNKNVVNPSSWKTNLEGFVMKIREEDLRRELEIALTGKDSQPRCSARLGMRLRKFKQLLRRARIHGVSAVLHSNMPKAYADSFKLDVANSVQNESLTLGTAGARYNLDECTVKAWVRKYQEGGENLLLEDGR